VRGVYGRGAYCEVGGGGVVGAGSVVWVRVGRAGGRGNTGEVVGCGAAILIPGLHGADHAQNKCHPIR